MKYLIDNHINKTGNYLLCKPIETPLKNTIIESLTDLYHYGLKEYGKCTGKMYIDYKNKSYHIGYIFLKRNTDCKETFLEETWLSIENKIYKPIGVN